MISGRLLLLSLFLRTFSEVYGVRTGDFPLTILHTNDVHARFLSFNDRQQPCTAKDISENMCWGGVARRQNALKKFTKEDENVLKLDAGDQFQGTVWYTALKWEPIATYMNIMKYDAMAFGNHEFDDGMDGLEPFVRNLTSPIVTSNIEDMGSPIKGLFKRYIIKEIGGQKIAIVGCTTAETPQLSSPGPQLEFRNEVRTLQPLVDSLISRGINKIIILSHAGVTIDGDICQQVRGVDIVVGGHSHTFLYTGKPPSTEKPEGPYPKVYSNPAGSQCLVVQDYAYGKYLGRLKVNFDGTGRLTNWSGNPIPLDAGTFIEDEEMAALLRPYKAQLEHFQKTIITNTAVGLDGDRKSCRLKECNLGNIVADAAIYAYVKLYMEHGNRKNGSQNGWAPAGICLWNGGGVRDFSTPAGTNVTLDDLYTIMPFGNTIDKITIKGSILKEALEHSVSLYNPGGPEGRFLQVSGVRVVYNLSETVGNRVHKVYVRCNHCDIPKYEPLDCDQVYDVVIPSYISQGGDGYDMIKANKLTIDGSNLGDVDILIDYLKTYKPVLTGEESRIEFAEQHIDLLKCSNHSGSG